MATSEETRAQLKRCMTKPDPKISFPSLVHLMLCDIERIAESGVGPDLRHVVGWQADGTAFKIHKKKDFEAIIMPLWFSRLKYVSWVRQLNSFGFKRCSKESPTKGAVYHEYFLRHAPELATDIQKINKRKCKGEDKKEDEQEATQSQHASPTFDEKTTDCASAISLRSMMQPMWSSNPPSTSLNSFSFISLDRSTSVPSVTPPPLVPAVSGDSQPILMNHLQSWPAWKDPMQSLDTLFPLDLTEEECADVEPQPSMDTFWDMEPLPF